MTSYLVTINSSVQAASVSRSLSSVLNYVLSALEVDQVATFSVRLQANIPQTVSFPGIVSLQLLSIQSPSEVDVSLVDESTRPVFTQVGSNLTLRVFTDGVPYSRIVLQSAVATTVELAVAGKLT
jgi:hypothetical protein